MDLTRLNALAETVAQRAKKRASASDTGRWYNFKASAADTTEIDLYDEIGGWGITASAFIADLRAVDTAKIMLNLNSPGGNVWDGIAIYTAVRKHREANGTHVTVSIDGIAASAASFIAMAGDEVVIEKPAKMMIHDAMAGLFGLFNVTDLRALIDPLDEMSDTIAEIYADRTGTDKETWRTAMKAETWYNANQAVEIGLADRVAGVVPAQTGTDNKLADAGFTNFLNSLKGITL